MERLFQFLELLVYKAWADLRAESARTYIGFAWWFIDPVLNMALFYFVFSTLMRRGVADYVPFLLTGTVVWKWFNSSVVVAANSIRANAGLINQVHIAKAFFPLVVVAETTVKFVIAFALLLAFLRAYGMPLGFHYAAIPALFGTALVFIVASSLVVASVVPFFPDLTLLLENALRILFFLSGIFFPVEQLPAALQRYFVLNPMVPIIAGFRDVLMYQRWPDWSHLIGVVLASLVVAAFGWGLLRRFDRVYPRSLR